MAVSEDVVEAVGRHDPSEVVVLGGRPTCLPVGPVLVAFDHCDGATSGPAGPCEGSCKRRLPGAASAIEGSEDRTLRCCEPSSQRIDERLCEPCRYGDADLAGGERDHPRLGHQRRLAGTPTRILS